MIDGSAVLHLAVPPNKGVVQLFNKKLPGNDTLPDGQA